MYKKREKREFFTEILVLIRFDRKGKIKRTRKFEEFVFNKQTSSIYFPDAFLFNEKCIFDFNLITEN